MEKDRFNYIRQLNKIPPIIFIDTNVIIDIKKGILGKSDRGEKLFKFLRLGVENNKFICPFVYQRDEYQKTSEEEMEIMDFILTSLSKGMQITIVRNKIIFRQIKRMMELWLSDSYAFDLKHEDIFNTRSDANNSIIFITSGGARPYDTGTIKQMYNHQINRSKLLRENSSTYKDVFKEELHARKDLFKKTMDACPNIHLLGNLIDELEIYSDLYCRLYPLIAYREIKSEIDIGKVLDFFDSNHYQNIPYEYIYSSLITQVLLYGGNPKLTDYKDLESLSIILPYAQSVITDRAMKGNIENTHLNKKFDVNIFSLNKLDDFYDKY